jgi:hypothetical protein
VAIAGAGINLVAVFYSQPNGGLVQKNVLVGAPVNVLAIGDYNHDGGSTSRRPLPPTARSTRCSAARLASH